MSQTNHLKTSTVMGKYDCVECGTDALTAHLATCSRKPRPIGNPTSTSTYAEASPAMQDALRRAYRLSRVVNEQIGVMVSISRPVPAGPPQNDKELWDLVRRRLYADGRKPHPGREGKIYRPWGKPKISLTRPSMDPLSDTIDVVAKWPQAVDLTKTPPIYATHLTEAIEVRPKPYPHTVCSCDPCREADCRPDYREASLGKCRDVFDQECVCSKTNASGECYGCMTWMDE